MKKIAVVLSGSGVFDGTELNEAVLTFLALEQHQLSYETFAPNIAQAHCVNHYSGEVVEEQRNVLVEANRITRSTTQDLDELNPDDFDALLFVGGFGAAKNLSNFAFTEGEYEVLPSVKGLIERFHQDNKFIVGLCITPVLLANVLSSVTLTLGKDKDIAALMQSKGHTHIDCPTEECVVDQANRLITTPAYMTAQSVLDAHLGIQATVKALADRL
ncbi:isoprenoid biosynthesis glyoxalase ElbB [Vibrio sp. WXL103]|uniref:isoprenoid biosynthesis glyoxalase ElbB n=1 Tax=Vibrio sp. WXL103 TaxID=3450710 RepID=UPI003EC7DB85